MPLHESSNQNQQQHLVSSQCDSDNDSTPIVQKLSLNDYKKVDEENELITKNFPIKEERFREITSKPISNDIEVMKEISFDEPTIELDNDDDDSDDCRILSDTESEISVQEVVPYQYGTILPAGVKTEYDPVQGELIIIDDSSGDEAEKIMGKYKLYYELLGHKNQLIGKKEA